MVSKFPLLDSVLLWSDHCANNQCAGDSTCVEEYGSYACMCSPGFKGPLCDVEHFTVPGQCINNGTCVEELHGFHCNCPEGFNGTQCEKNIDDCHPVDPCPNGTTCQDGVNTYSCVCQSIYRGLNCELFGICCLLFFFLFIVFVECAFVQNRMITCCVCRIDLCSTSLLSQKLKSLWSMMLN